jgi:hypothetical protein
MRVLRATGVTALVAALAAGCAGEDAPEVGDPDTALARAPQVTADADSARVALAASMSLEGVEEALDFGGEGEIDLEADVSRLDLDLSEMATFQTGGEGADPGLWRGTVIYTGDGTLMKLPAFNALTPEPDKWLRWNADALVREGGTQFSAPDPIEFLRFVRAARDAEVEGEQEIRGVDTTHLRANVTVDDLPGVASEEDETQAEAYAQRLRTAGVESFPLHVWLDAQGRVRRLEARYEDMMVANGRTADITTSLELFDFGGGEDLTLPRASEVVDINDVIGRGPEETQHSEE